ncbi:hypothetical protein FOQG_04187 [Fusarium oxysporum f. sp. raphani 54005]|uniref:Uncharacterized protein n=1 Tax=Fusarium oxysporum f. sp. raphani 54005 TaxID=1089458 RepID=X0DMR0_FUSOX|nr:hypothetical protein FOQG_04187 [Fusarium oxysporum f. sp. raphani 54005]
MFKQIQPAAQVDSMIPSPELPIRKAFTAFPRPPSQQMPVMAPGLDPGQGKLSRAAFCPRNSVLIDHPFNPPKTYRYERTTRQARGHEPSTISTPSKRTHVDEDDDDPSDEALAHAKHLFHRRRPVSESTTADNVERITQPTPEGWSAEDETVVSGSWDGSSAKIYSAKINQGQHAAFLALFKTSIRVLGLAPITMISPIHCLRYQPVSRDNSGLE